MHNSKIITGGGQESSGNAYPVSSSVGVRRGSENELKIPELLKTVWGGVLQALAVLVAFFTFVSVEFQLFANSLSFGEVLVLSMLLAGVLLLFIIALLVVFNYQLVWLVVLAVASLLLISVPVYVFLSGRITTTAREESGGTGPSIEKVVPPTGCYLDINCPND